MHPAENGSNSTKAAGTTTESAATGPAAKDGVDLYPVADSSAPADGAAVGPDGRPALLRPRTRPEDQLLILQVRLRDLILSEGMYGYLDEGGLMLPLSEFVRALDFPITVDPSNGRASGWYIKEGKLFSLDYLTREVVIDGHKRQFNRQLVELHEDDIYIDTRLLADWFPVDISFDLSNLIVNLKSREPLPVEQRMARDVRRSKALAQRARVGEQYRQVDAPYAWASWPTVNLNAEAGYSRDTLGDSFLRSRYGLLATGDYLKNSATLFVGGDEQKGVSDARLEIGRKDPDGQMLGFLKATEYNLGDVVTPQVDLVARSRFGRGAELSSFPLSRTGSFDSTTVVGELPLGWEVELYRNGVLLGFRSSRPDGRYEFPDVQLLFGLNILQLQFYGPQGQYREENRRILVGPGQVPPGRVNFRIAASQQDERLLPVDNSDTLSTTDLALQGEPRGTLELEYGATKHFSLAASAATIPLPAGRQSYGGLGLRFGAGPVYGRLDVIRSSDGGTAGKLGAQFDLPFNLVLSANQGLYNGFSSETIEDDGDLPVSTTDGRLDGVVPLWEGRRLPFNFTGAYEKSESGASTLDVGNRLSLALGRVSMSNNLQWRQSRTAAATTTSAGGSFLLGGRAWGVGLRGNVGYLIKPDSRLNSASLTAEWLFGSGFSARVGAARSFGADVNTLSAGLSRRFRAFSLGLTGSYSDDGSGAVLLTFGLSAIRDPHSGDWALRRGELAGKGAASARVFLDNDYNGVFSAGDEPVQGATFKTGYGLSTEKTDENGIALLTGLPPNSKMPISVPPQGLSDPYWVADPEGYVVPLRPGRTAALDFPIVVTGEIDGTVALRQGNALVNVSDVKLQLVGADGQVVAATTSAFDGFYLFEQVRPGNYTVRVDPEQVKRLHLAGATPKAVVIGGDGTVASGTDFILGEAH